MLCAIVERLLLLNIPCTYISQARSKQPSNCHTIDLAVSALIETELYIPRTWEQNIFEFMCSKRNCICVGSNDFSYLFKRYTGE